MGKTGKWLRNFLTGKKDKEKEKEKEMEKSAKIQPSTIITENPTTTPISTTPTTPIKKRRWSFRRSSATAASPKYLNSTDSIVSSTTPQPSMQAKMVSESEQKEHAIAVVAATAAAVDAAVAAAQAAATMIQLSAAANGRATAKEEAAAIKIQAAFRSHLARKALCALRGLVKLQALVRGHLVRKRATATLRCIQALVTAQARSRAQRVRMVEEAKPMNPRPSTHRKSTHENRIRHSYHLAEDLVYSGVLCKQENDRGMGENIKIVEMDIGEEKGNTKSRNNYLNHPQAERADQRFSTHHANLRVHTKQDNQHISPASSALTDISPRACSGHFEDYSFTIAQSSPQCYSAMSKIDQTKVPFAFPRQEYAESLSYEHPLYPNYMANTESSRAKARSQSAPKQRLPDSFERQPSRRRPSIEGRNVPRAVRMQRSSSHIGTAVQGYQYPWSIKLDRSNVSLKDSECGSTSTVLTNTYCRSLVTYDAYGNRD
ncbi:IQ motif, EF-hand binding site [Dillenia turbinata]|uniref:IQ motif, EF-hand binding site n=1 Tax=Dillenia turbinata TaxID=194707 RepID=A0AAN8YV76_9MAGN